MSNCPHCNTELKIDYCVYMNVETYGKSALATSKCCGRAVVVSRVVNFGISAYNGERTEDDWGNCILQTTPVSQSCINDELAINVTELLKADRLYEALEIIRGIKNPLTAGWLVQEVLNELNVPSRTQTKNWLINALYNGK
ncbi:hypothetical protein RCIP0023_00181 [Klebsiella phage RCIP0023]